MSRIYTSAEQLIGNTPLLKLTQIEREYDLQTEILAKLEYFNPAGSVKDRVAKAILDDAENTGKLNQLLEIQVSVLLLLLRPEDIVSSL